MLATLWLYFLLLNDLREIKVRLGHRVIPEIWVLLDLLAHQVLLDLRGRRERRSARPPGAKGAPWSSWHSGWYPPPQTNIVLMVHLYKTRLITIANWAHGFDCLALNRVIVDHLDCKVLLDLLENRWVDDQVNSLVASVLVSSCSFFVDENLGHLLL